MERLQIDILNPKAKKILVELAELNLIKINNFSSEEFVQLLESFRSKAKSAPTIDEISKEIKSIRKLRYDAG